jgi:integrase
LHDLWHYFASLLIAAGLDVKVVQTRLRHASAVTTLNMYGHMFPDKDESARAAVAAALAARADSMRTQGVVTAL